MTRIVAIDLTNKIFGNWLVLGLAETPYIGNKRYWICKCKCGKVKNIQQYSLTRTQQSSKSCGCWKVEHMGNLNQLEAGLAGKRRLIHSYKKGAKARNLSFELSFEEFIELVQKNCHYCGIVPSNSTKTLTHHSSTEFIYNGIDRKDNKLGYTKENSLPCCKQCNYAKFRFSYQEFLNYIERLRYDK